MLKELGNAQKQRIGGLAQLTVRVKPSQKARKARNPATNKESTIAAKPASPHASADEGHGRAAKRAESPPATGRANGLTQPWRSGSRARRSVVSPSGLMMMRRCVLSCGSSRCSGRGGGTVARIIGCGSWAGR
jgi:hypothetical protein